MMCEVPLCDERFKKGWEKIKEIDQGILQDFYKSLLDISPDFARQLVQFPFGDVYSRPALDSRRRELAIVSAIAALGHAQPQLRLHLHAAIKVGCTRDELIEVLMMTAVYSGFPAALNAFATFGSVLKEVEAPCKESA
ncbi:carboxymuconolactone decarboxylase family protein [Azohydromonas lata]|uniref:carboxymuconolactone decarboxylase family protein n=1 Tax=Azohydromonas lata TaxID=45677 RepID=UPI000AC97243|nr:carboxymuconolactone decarboxylase family protein [Azohydromonas lata]